MELAIGIVLVAAALILIYLLYGLTLALVIPNIPNIVITCFTIHLVRSGHDNIAVLIAVLGVFPGYLWSKLLNKVSYLTFKDIEDIFYPFWGLSIIVTVVTAAIHRFA